MLGDPQPRSARVLKFVWWCFPSLAGACVPSPPWGTICYFDIYIMLALPIITFFFLSFTIPFARYQSQDYRIFMSFAVSI